jgi:hypothetical protein
MKIGFVIFCLVISTYTFASQKLEIIDTDKDRIALAFDPKLQYLNVSIAGLDPIIPDAPNLWERVTGTKTSHGLIYIEVASGAIVKKIPLLTYSLNSDKNYEVNSISAGSGITFTLLDNIVFDTSNPPRMKLVVRYWEDEDKLDLIKSMASAANMHGSMTAAEVDEVLAISSTFISLVEKMWPTDNQTKSIELTLSASNLKWNQIWFGYENSTTPILTLGLSVNKSYFSNKPFNSGLNEYKPQQLDVFRDTITQANDNLANAGLEPLYNSIKSYSSYVDSLELNYADKVLLLAHSIQNWAYEAVVGSIISDENEVMHLSFAKYRRLENADKILLDKLTDDVLTQLDGWKSCTTDHCINMAEFLSKIAVEKDINKYLPPSINILIDGAPQRMIKDDFLKGFKILSDPGWDQLSNIDGRDDKWIASFIDKRLYIQIKKDLYRDHDVLITMSKIKKDIGSDFEFLISNIEINKKVSPSIAP